MEESSARRGCWGADVLIILNSQNTECDPADRGPQDRTEKFLTPLARSDD